VAVVHVRRCAPIKHSGSPPGDSSGKVLVLVGPTASGKTLVSLSLARRLNGEIISADSRQIYRRLDIGTAKVSPADRESVRHLFVDELEPDQDFNAGEFGKCGRTAIDDIIARRKVPIVVGGSGLYVQALIDGFFDGPAADPSVRSALYRRAREEGNEALLEELRRLDPEAARRMLPANIRRIVRALEVVHLTGVPISEYQRQRIEINFIPVFCGLKWERSLLYRRIDERVDRMLADGFIDEVRNLERSGFPSELNALQTVGYKEVFEFLKGNLSYDEMVQLIKRNSRRYAKRQLTWFRRDRRIRWFDVRDETDLPAVASSIQEYFESYVS